MQQNLENSNTQYFYIIRNIIEDKFYAGSRYANGCNPKELLKNDGYCTSSNTVKLQIALHGLEIFEIVEIVTDFGFLNNAYDFETWFLQLHNCAASDRWYNMHNNDFGSSYGTEPFKINMMNKHGVTHCMHDPKTKEKLKNTNLERYGVVNVFQNEDIKEKIKNVNFEKHGRKCIVKICIDSFVQD